MPRAAFLALVGRTCGPVFDEAEQRIAALPSWRRAARTSVMAVWTTAEPPLPVTILPCEAGVVLGDLFAPSNSAKVPTTEADAPRDAHAWAAWLARHRWGRYVALLRSPPHEAAAFRDPSGQVDALLWPLGEGLHLVISDLRRTPPGLWPPRQRLNWDRIAAYLGSPANRTTEPLFDGMRAVGPGELLDLQSTGAGELVWRPSDHIRNARIDPCAQQQELVRRVDDCVSTLAAGYDRLNVEVSGGLDSAIVATSLHATGHATRVTHWVNQAVRRAAGDETAYAHAVTDRVGGRLTITLKAADPLTPSDLMELADGAWPGMNGVEASRDRDEAERLVADGAGALLSGQGGDAIFFQPPTPLVIADAWRIEGWRALGSRLLPETARRTRTSVWEVLQAARRTNGDTNGAQVLGLVTPAAAELGAATPHRWTRDAEAANAPPAKRRQVQIIANHHVYHGESRVRRVADEVYPLLAQPVIEHCLGIPIPDLVRGGGDRPFARAAFAHRLPDLVRARRSKGAQTAHFAQLVAASLPELRPFLLEGNLAMAGILDRTELERRLDPQYLITHPGGSQLLWAASMEAWVRHWQTRVPDSPGAARWDR